MLRTCYLSFGLLVATALALPLNETTSLIDHRSLQRRAAPLIDTKFGRKKTEQIQDGIADALRLAESVVHGDPKVVRSVMGKYFDPADFPAVQSEYL